MLNASAPELLAAIVDSSDDGIVSKTLEGIITSWNRSAERIFGYTAHEVIGRSVAMLFPADRLPEEAHLISEIAAGRRVEHFETERIRKDGRRIPVAVTLSPVRDDAGRVIGASTIVRDITPRRAAEEVLRGSRDVLALAMRAGQMGAWSRNLATDEVWWSRELEELVGLPPGGFAGTRAGFLSLVHDNDRPQVEEAVASAVAGGHDYHVEFRFRHATQGWRWMEGRGRILRDDQGRPAFVYGLAIDITQRKAFEEALAAARDAADADAQRLNVALAAARLGDWTWDRRTDLVSLSPRAAEIFDVPPGARLTWTQLHELLHPEDRERARAALGDSLARRTDHAIEYRLINGGHERWVSVCGRARYDEQKRPVLMFGVAQDITRDRLLLRIDDAVRPLADPEAITSTAARILGEHLRVQRCAYAVVDEDGDGFVLTDNYTAGVPSSVGRFRFAQFGAECRRLLRLGRPWMTHDHEHDPRLEDDEREAYRASAIRAMACVPILKADRLVAALAVHSSTPRAWRPDEIELVQQAASRCWESIERARVERERVDLLEAAEAANRAKDEFMAMLGHELRNPLSPILTALQLMKLRGQGGAERERTVIERQVTHLTRLVDDLLDVSRITRGKVELRVERTELAEAVARAVEVASPLLEERMQVLTIDVPRAGLPVEADPARLSQVISNLLTNAAKYTPARGRVSVSAVLEHGDVVLRVRDTGIGIAADALPRVFDLFVQGRQSIDRAQGGLGLGLTIVKNLVERHGGHVEARSDGPGRGSEFIVRLPAAGGDVVSPGSSLPGLHVPVPTGGTRILVVDDNEDAASMLAQALLLHGYETRVAHDGPAALALAAGFRPDVAFLDIGLPVMDGYELAARLRELDVPHLRLIAVTGYGQESDRQRTRAAGFEQHVVKPVEIDALVALAEAAERDRT